MYYFRIEDWIRSDSFNVYDVHLGPLSYSHGILAPSEVHVGSERLCLREKINAQHRLPHSSPVMSLREEVLLLFRHFIKSNPRNSGGKDSVDIRAILTYSRRPHWFLSHVITRAYDPLLPDVSRKSCIAWCVLYFLFRLQFYSLSLDLSCSSFD